MLEDALAQVACEEERARPLRSQRGKESQMGDADVLCLVDDSNSNGVCLPAASAAARAVNMPACVVSRSAINPLRTCSKTVHSTARCASGSLVLRPSRVTSRYDSHVSNCQASTTCSHSVRRNCRPNLCPLTALDATLISPCTASRLANVTGPQCDL